MFAAERATPELVNFAVKYGRGILCAPMAPQVADRLGLKLMVPHNTAKFGTPFTESVDAVKGTTTGTSAFDRAKLPFDDVIDAVATADQAQKLEDSFE